MAREKVVQPLAFSRITDLEQSNLGRRGSVHIIGREVVELNEQILAIFPRSCVMQLGDVPGM
jgi:hypothetical protein